MGEAQRATKVSEGPDDRRPGGLTGESFSRARAMAMRCRWPPGRRGGAGESRGSGRKGGGISRGATSATDGVRGAHGAQPTG